jgi:hypothetical protein
MESLLRYMGSMLETGLGVMREMVTGTFKNIFSGEDIDMSFAAMFDRAGGAAANAKLAERMRGAMEMAGETLAKTATDDLRAKLQARLATIPTAAKAAEAGLLRCEAQQTAKTSKAAKEVGRAAGEAAAKAAAKVSNQLIMGGTNAATRLSLLGPSYQNEQKKQTDLLKKIADNTAKTAEEGEQETYPVTDVGA